MLLRGAFGQGLWGFYGAADHVTRDRRWLWRISDHGALVRYPIDNLEDELVLRVCDDGDRIRAALFDEGAGLAAFVWVKLASGASRAERWNIDAPRIERVVLRSFESPGEGPYDLVRSACGNFVMFSSWDNGLLFSGAAEATSRLVSIVRAEFIGDSGGRQTLAIDADRLVTFDRSGLIVISTDGRQVGSIAVRAGRANSLDPLGAMRVALTDYDWGSTADCAAVDLSTGAAISLGVGPSYGHWLFDDRVHVVRRRDDQEQVVEVYAFDGRPVETRPFRGTPPVQLVGDSLYEISSRGAHEYDARSLASISESLVEAPIDGLFCDESANVVVARSGEMLALHSARTAERLCEHALGAVALSIVGFCDGGSTLIALERLATDRVALVEYALSASAIERRWESAPIELEGFRVSSDEVPASVDRAVLVPLHRDGRDERGEGRRERRWLIVRRNAGDAPLPIGWRAIGDLAVCAIDALDPRDNVGLLRSHDPAVWCAIETFTRAAVVGERTEGTQAFEWRNVEWIADGTQRATTIATIELDEFDSVLVFDSGVLRLSSGLERTLVLVRHDGSTAAWSEARGTQTALRGACDGRLKLFGALVDRTLVLRRPDGTIVGSVTCDDPLETPTLFAVDEGCTTCAIVTSRGRLLVYSLDRGLGTVL